MKELILTTATLYLVPSEPPADGKMRPMVELILVASEPRYTADDTGAMVRSRTTETIRVHTPPEGIRLIIKNLGEIADLGDALAKRVNGPAEQVEKAKADRAPTTRRRGTKPEATIRKELNGHKLLGEKWGGQWTLICPSWPDLAAQHSGSEDAGPCIEEFEKRATAGGAGGTGTEERKECVE